MVKDRVKYFRRTTWHNIKQRIEPGGKYYGRVLLLLSREQYYLWCEKHRDVIEKMYLLNEQPSIDRIDSSGHYEAKNIQILPLNANRLEGVIKAKELREKEWVQLMLTSRFCAACFTQLKRKVFAKTMEPMGTFKSRKTCGVKCAAKIRKRNSIGEFGAIK